MNATIDLLLARRSALFFDIGEPGPSRPDLETILKISSRVPDHGKLNPWRFIIFQGDARAKFGKVLVDAYDKAVAEPDDRRRAGEEKRFSKAPVIVAVISKEIPHIKIPHWEQILSAGAACQNMLIAADALGFAAQWTSDWIAYDKNVLSALDLEPGEQVAGFIYLGTASTKLEDRPRPDLDEIVSYWGE